MLNCKKKNYNTIQNLHTPHTDDNGRIVYTITAGDELGAFHIHPNGTIVTRSQLDRETRSSYGLVVQATDAARPPEQRLSSTVQVSV